MLTTLALLVCFRKSGAGVTEFGTDRGRHDRFDSVVATAAKAM